MLPQKARSCLLTTGGQGQALLPVLERRTKQGYLVAETSVPPSIPVICLSKGQVHRWSQPVLLTHSSNTGRLATARAVGLRSWLTPLNQSLSQHIGPWLSLQTAGWLVAMKDYPVH